MAKHEQVESENNADCFFEANGLVHKDVVPPVRTIDVVCYIDVLDRFRKSRLCAKEFTATWSATYDKAPGHTALAHL